MVSFPGPGLLEKYRRLDIPSVSRGFVLVLIVVDAVVLVARLFASRSLKYCEIILK